MELFAQRTVLRGEQFNQPCEEVITVKYKLVHLDYNDNKIFDIREMSEKRAYTERGA